MNYMSNKTEKLSLRLTKEQKQLLEEWMIAMRQPSLARVIELLIEEEAKRRNLVEKK